MRDNSRNNRQNTSPVILPQHYKLRRDKFISQLLPNSVAFIASNQERVRTGDTNFPFRQSSNGLYLSGLQEQQSLDVYTNIPGQPRFQLLVMPRDPEQERWTGIREGVEGAKADYGADEAYPIDKFEEVAGKLLAQADYVYYKFKRNDEIDTRFSAIWVPSQKPLFNPENILHEMRLFKRPEEIAVMRRAAEISVAGHRYAMKRVRAGLKEYQVQSDLERVFGWHGAIPAYPSIVAAGANGYVLHYITNRDVLKDGELLLVDAACELYGYASDVTITSPINGRFTPAQADICQLDLDAQAEGIRVAVPGSTLADVHNAVCGVLEKGLKKFGILPPDCDGSDHPGIACGAAHASLSRAVKLGIVPAPEHNQLASMSGEPARANLRDYYPHGTSHWLGLDTHDVGDYKTEDGTRTDKGKGKMRILEPGMVITVEPGIYIGPNDTRVPEKYRNTNVRYEADVLITNDGNEILSKGAPRTLDEIEHIMRRSR